jgi:flagellar hook-length control protein FliK
LDASQISIKINQTSNQGGGKTKSAAQSNDSANSFDQILAMINSIRQSVNSDGVLGAPASKNESNTQGNSKIETGNLSIEDWKKLDAVLTSLILAMQQSQQPTVPLQNQTVNQSQGSTVPLQNQIVNQSQGPTVPLQNQTINQSQGTESILQAVSGMLSSFQEANNSLAKLLQKSERANQTAVIEPKQLMNGLAELLGEISSQEKQNPSDLLKDISGKIQKIMDELNSKTGEGPSFNIQLNHNNPIIALTPQLSLDKSQVIFSTIKDSAKKNMNNAKLAGLPAANPIEDPLKANGQSLVATHPLQVQEGLNDIKTGQSSPSLTISEFTPEVRELIGRYLRITNGQSGSTEAKFSLYPEHLGPVEVKIVTQQGQVSAQIVTNTSIAKEALEGQLQHLKDALQQQGVAVQKLDIIQQTPMTMGSNQTNLSFFQNGSNSSNDQRNDPAQEDLSKKSNEENQNDLDKEIMPVSYGAAAPKTASIIDFIA